MPVVQPVLETVTNTLYIYIYIYMIIVGKSMPIDNYEQYKRLGDYTCIVERGRKGEREGGERKKKKAESEIICSIVC